jgi:hypothetical protein
MNSDLPEPTTFSDYLQLVPIRKGYGEAAGPSPQWRRTCVFPETAMCGAQPRSLERFFVNAADTCPVLLRPTVRTDAQAVSARSCAARARRARTRMIWSKL